MERILPLPEPLRLRLIEKYCAPRIKSKAISDPANKDCLVRVYLGSTRGRAGQFFSLRNLKLHLNQLVEINLDVEAIARRMASALAVMHWAAKTDARDVEFVLGSATTSLAKTPEQILQLKPNSSTGPESRRDEDFFHRTTELWVLDFNQVRKISMDEAGVGLALEAIKLNDPYFPKPLQSSTMEKRLWNSFTTSYIETSDSILGKVSPYVGLPRLFIRGLINLEDERQEYHRD